MDIERPVLLEEWYQFFYRAMDSRSTTYSSGGTFCAITGRTVIGATKVDITRNSQYFLVFDNGDRLSLARRHGAKRCFSLPTIFKVFGTVDAMMLAILTKALDPAECIAPDGGHVVWKGHLFVGRITGLPSKYSSRFRKGVPGSNITLDRLGVIKRTKQIADNTKENQFWTLI